MIKTDFSYVTNVEQKNTVQKKDANNEKKLIKKSYSINSKNLLLLKKCQELER